MPALKNIVTPELKQAVKTLFDQEIGARKIAQILGISRNFVQKIYKALGIYNSGRQKPRNAYKQTEKCCKMCKQTQSIEHFRKRIGKYSDGTERISFEPYCKACEYEKDLIRLKARAKKLRKADPNFVLRRLFSHAIWRGLKNAGSSKKAETCLKYLGYTIAEARAYIESKFEWWMTWDNYGKYETKTWNDNDPSTWKWNIDHIIPQEDLPYVSMEDENFKICWSLNNLRPLDAKQNQIDGITRIRHKKKG
jgi:hypothetical protein